MTRAWDLAVGFALALGGTSRAAPRPPSVLSTRRPRGRASPGPLGMIASWALSRVTADRKEHATGRGAAWAAVDRLRQEIREGNETLVRIETILKERR